MCDGLRALGQSITAYAGQFDARALSAGQASEVAAADPTKAAELIETARHSSLPELNEEVALVKAGVTDQEKRWRAVDEKRSLKRWTDRDGAMHGHLYGHPEDGARLWRMLDPIRRRLNLLRRQAGLPHDTFEALDYDALMTMASIASGKDGELSLADLIELGLFPQITTITTRPDPDQDPSEPQSNLFGGPPEQPSADRGEPVREGSRAKKMAGSPIRIMVRVDLDALLRGFPRDGELCEISGYGPVPVSVIEDLLATENPFIIGLLTKGQTLSGVYHHGRHPNAYQRSALDFLHPTCAATGCSSKAGLQYDHREDFARTRITAFDLLDRLCPHHHRQKTNHGWALIEGRGRRAFVAPDDPRHPRNHPP